MMYLTSALVVLVGAAIIISAHPVPLPPLHSLDVPQNDALAFRGFNFENLIDRRDRLSVTGLDRAAGITLNGIDRRGIVATGLDRADNTEHTTGITPNALDRRSDGITATAVDRTGGTASAKGIALNGLDRRVAGTTVTASAKGISFNALDRRGDGAVSAKGTALNALDRRSDGITGTAVDR